MSQEADELRTALRASQDIEAGLRAEMQNRDAGPRLSKMIDFRLPLYWIIGGAVALIWALVSMWFSLQQIKEDMTQLKAATVVAAATTSEMALLKFRLTSIESDVAQLKSASRGKP